MSPWFLAAVRDINCQFGWRKSLTAAAASCYIAAVAYFSGMRLDGETSVQTFPPSLVQTVRKRRKKNCYCLLSSRMVKKIYRRLYVNITFKGYITLIFAVQYLSSFLL